MHEMIEGLLETISTFTPDYPREGGWRYVAAWLLFFVSLIGLGVWLALRR